MGKSEPPKKITFKYIFPDDYNPLYVNGAIGGLTPTGEIIINFYHERIALPNSQTFRLNQEGGIINEVVSSDPADHSQSLVRFIQSGVTFDVDKAKIIYQWLGEQIETAEAIKESSIQKKN